MQAQADQEAQDKRRRGSRQQRRSKPQQPTRATTGSQRERVVAESMRSVKEVQDHDGPKMAKLASPTRPIGAKTSIGTLDRARLRKAFVMKELLDKPVALRDPQADLL